MPLFSIIIPSFNQEEFLNQNVISVVNQQFDQWELLIVDDESTDGSLELAKKLAHENSKIKVLEKKNGGLSSSRNFGIQNASGKYLYFIDADDLMLPRLLEKASKLIQEQEPDIIQFGYRYLLNADGRILYEVYPRNRFTFPEIFEGSPGSSHSFIVKREMIEKVGLFDETLKSVEDWDYWLRVAKYNPKVALINEPLVDYRQHELSMSRNYIVMYQAFKEVAFRAPNYDARIPLAEKNFNYDIDMLPVIKKAMLRFTALAILQGNIEIALELFKTQSTKFNWNWKINEFREMNSYLTFRYRYSKEDLEWVFEKVIPLYQQFFLGLGYSNDKIRKIVEAIFYYHLCNKNKNNYAFIGRVFNYFKFFPSINYFFK